MSILLMRVAGLASFDLLDFYCGPGRDLLTFKALGHHTVGLEGAYSLAARARCEQSGCEVLKQSFLQLDLPAKRSDGVSANTSLFYVPSQLLLLVLHRLHACGRA